VNDRIIELILGDAQTKRSEVDNSTNCKRRDRRTEVCVSFREVVDNVLLGDL
jgi:hypothetical protein